LSKEKKDMSVSFKVGDVAMCRHGYIGLITNSKQRTKVCDDGGNEPVVIQVWTGIQLENRRDVEIGDPWQSKDPTFLCNLTDLRNVVESE
jgi:hypothetical protein